MTAAKQAKFAERLTTFDDLPKVLLPNIAQSVVDRRALRLASKNFSQTLEHLECVNAKELEIMRQSQVPPCKNTARVMYKSDMNMQRAIMCAIMSPDNKLHVYVETDHLEPFLDSQIVKCFDKNYKLKLTLLYHRDPTTQEYPEDPPPRPNLRCAGGFRPLKGGWARNGRLQDQEGVEVVRFTGNTHVAENAFRENKRLIELLDVNTIEDIHDYAFYEVKQLRQLGDMPALKTIGKRAFFGTNLTQLGDMPALTGIGVGAFAQTQLEQLGDMEKLTTIGGGAFYKTKLAKIGDMTLLTEIGESAFYRTNLTQIGDMQALKTICERAFLGTPLAQLGNMQALETIGNQAFYDTPLKHIGDLRSLKTIGNGAFQDTKLAQLGDLSSLTTIGDWAFTGTPLAQLGNMQELKTIGNRAFYLTSLKQLGDLSSLTTIGDFAFFGTPLAQLGDMRSLTTIGNFAFANCRDLSVVRLPKTLEEVKKNAFLGLAGEITVEPGANFVCKCVLLAEKLDKITDVRVEREGPGTYRIEHIYDE